MEEIFADPSFLIIFYTIIIILLSLAIFTYIFYGLAYMKIAKKLKLQYPGLSWVPLIGPAIISYKASKMHWWPWIFIAIGYFSIFINDFFIVEMILILLSMVGSVMVIVWSWKMFERLKRPGWWALLFLIPIVNYVLVGIAAWSDKK